jgi:RNA polymerase sigma-70 factor (ECF subfamily)
MTEDTPFAELIRRVRAGDPEAAAELVRGYEPTIRRTVRVRLRDQRLGRLFDSMDVCQSVLASFFVRAALGQFQLDTPEQLLKLLATMARNKLAGQAKRQQARCRDYRLVEGEALDSEPAGGVTPSREAAARDLLAEARRRLTPGERLLLELRDEGRTWEEIAATLGGSPDALRIRLTRAVKRIAAELGLDEVDGDR